MTHRRYVIVKSTLNLELVYFGTCRVGFSVFDISVVRVVVVTIQLKSNYVRTKIVEHFVFREMLEIRVSWFALSLFVPVR